MLSGVLTKFYQIHSFSPTLRLLNYAYKEEALLLHGRQPL